jgi:hypothetical protein
MAPELFGGVAIAGGVGHCGGSELDQWLEKGDEKTIKKSDLAERGVYARRHEVCLSGLFPF